MEAKSRRARVWRVSGFTILALSVIVGGRFLWGRWEADRRWAAMGREVDLIKAEAVRRGGPRPTIHKDPEPGNAWEDYGSALEELKRSGVEQDLLWTIILGSPKVQESEIDALIKSSQTALEQLRRGVRKAEARYPIEWDARVRQGGKKHVLWDLDVGLAALCTVRHFRVVGRSFEALDLLLDTVLLARDLAHAGWPGYERGGVRLLEYCCGEIRSLILSRSMEAGDCQRISRALERIDPGFPSEGLSIMNAVASLAGGRMQGVPLNQMFPPVKLEIEGPVTPGWRHGYSTRLMELEAFERILTVARRYAGFGDQSWAEVRNMEAEGLAFLRENGWTSFMRMPPVLDRRRTLAHLRILRMAAHWLGTGEVRPLVDPFGPWTEVEKHLKGGGRRSAREPSVLQSRGTGNRWTFWSVGADGVDDGGKADKDIVVEVTR